MSTEIKIALIFVIGFAAVYLVALNRNAIKTAVVSVVSNKGTPTPTAPPTTPPTTPTPTPTPIPTPTPTPPPPPTPTPTPPPPPFIILKDDGAARNVHGDIAYMGSRDNGNDGSIYVDENDADEKAAGNTSMRFTYEPPANENHWAGMMFLFGPDAYTDDPGEAGPDLNLYTKMTFYTKGGGGTVKFFIECDGGPQSVEFVEVTDDWTPVTLHIDDSWQFVNVMFGWACNNNDVNPGASLIEFWADDLRYE